MSAGQRMRAGADPSSPGAAAMPSTAATPFAWTLRLASLAAVAGLLSACAGGEGGSRTRVYGNVVSAAYSPSGLRASGEIPLVVLGAPPDGSSPAEVAAAMTLPGNHGGAQTVATPAESAPRRRLVILFAPGNPDSICTATDAGGGSASGRTEATLAYCDGDKTLSGANMSSGATQGPRDEGFRPAIRQLYSMALPTRNPVHSRGAGGGGR
jgi:hypothetical protein